jgi:nucleoside-diphosphate-sugar epimerase
LKRELLTNSWDYVLRKYEFPFAELKVAAVDKLRATPSLKYTRFITGTFMDYFGPPDASHLRLITLIVDIENAKAAIPGDGNIPIVLTHSRDVAKFVAEALSLEEWPEACFVAGEKITLNELVSVAESVKGMCKESGMANLILT